MFQTVPYRQSFRYDVVKFSNQTQDPNRSDVKYLKHLQVWKLSSFPRS